MSIEGLLKFPGFGTGTSQGGGQGITGVAPISINAPRVNFPVSRTPPETTERKELTDLEKLTPAVIGLLGITERATSGSANKPTKEEIAEYNKTIDATSLSDIEKKAYKDAYRIYGKPRDLGTSGYDIARSVLPLISGRTAPDSAKLATSITSAGDRIDATVESNRAQFIKDRTKPPTYSQLTLIKAEDLIEGVIKEGTIVPGRFVKAQDGGYEQFYNTDTNQYEKNDGTYVEVPASLANSLNNLKFGPDKELPQEFKDANSSVNDKVENFIAQLALFKPLKEQLGQKNNVVGTTVTSALKGKFNSLVTEFDSVFGNKVFNNGMNDLTGDEYNKNTKKLVDDIQTIRDSGLTGSELQTAITNRMNQFIEIDRTGADQLSQEDNETLQNFAKASANNIELASIMIQLAYMSAGSAGQTGRTLSDKDLAFFLRIIGFESTSDPKVLLNNITKFFDRQITQIDAPVQTNFNIEQFGIYGDILTNKKLAAGLNPYYSYQGADGTVYDTWNDVPQNQREILANKGPFRLRTFDERFKNNNIYKEYLELRGATTPTVAEALSTISPEEREAAEKQGRQSVGLD